MVMLWIYCGLQLVLLILGIKVIRINYWLRWIQPGNTRVIWPISMTSQNVGEEMYSLYNNVCWYPLVEIIVFEVYGRDIGEVIMDYCRSIIVQNGA